ncbi:MAG TPA: tetratricopeptide repeat protein [Polyangia bacterium]|nr:tetratricopeptide repeat protein [Polyangia bacterium]HVZ73867.1 tetratricopeptide repeat protein [Polyangia bacterium]
MKTPRVWVVLVGVGLSGTAAAQSSPQAQSDFSRGQALVIAKKPADAAEKFEAVTKAEPEFGPGWYALAAARRRAGQCDKAIPAYRRYAQMMPDEPEPYYGLGLCLKEAGQLASSALALRRYVQLETRESSQKWVEHARAVIEEIGNAPDATPAAAAPLPEAKGPTPTPPPQTIAGADGGAPVDSPAAPLYAKSQQLRDSGHIEESIAKFKEAIAADPQHMVARAALGELLLKIRRDDEAINVFRAAVQKNPEYPLAWYELAFALRVKGRLPESVDAYQRYIKLRPTDPDPYYGLARALQRLGKKDAARRAYQTYLSMEKRPTEQKWIDAANGELQALGGDGAAKP